MTETGTALKPVEEYGMNPMWDLRDAVRRIEDFPIYDGHSVNPDAFTDLICEQLRLLHKGWPDRVEDVKRYMENEL